MYLEEDHLYSMQAPPPQGWLRRGRWIFSRGRGRIPSSSERWRGQESRIPNRVKWTENLEDQAPSFTCLLSSARLFIKTFFVFFVVFFFLLLLDLVPLLPRLGPCAYLYLVCHSTAYFGPSWHFVWTCTILVSFVPTRRLKWGALDVFYTR